MLPLMLSLAFMAAAPPEDSPAPSSPRPHPLAPSLPATTDADEDRFDRVIDRFIDYDTGKLKGAEAKKALEDFKGLPPESIFALIRGLNKAAKINDSCPALVIARRIASQVKTTRDRELLQYAKENVGVGVEKSRHMNIIKDLKLSCSHRSTALDQEKAPNIRSNP